MAIRFGEHCLMDENGKVYLISYRELLEECLKHPFNTPSISTIIIETIKRLTGETIIGNRYNDKPLYRWLEKKIQADSRYQQAKKEKREKDAKRKQQIVEDKKLHVHTRNVKFIEDYLRKECQNYYRRTGKRR